MSGQRVDVLAVLDHIADCDYIPVSTADLNATRAAVAELIEAIKLYRRELQKPCGAGEYAVALDRLNAALANVGSAP